MFTEKYAIGTKRKKISDPEMRLYVKFFTQSTGVSSGADTTTREMRIKNWEMFVDLYVKALGST